MKTKTDSTVEYKCDKCAQTLFKGLLVSGEIEISCSRCMQINEFMATSETESD